MNYDLKQSKIMPIQNLDRVIRNLGENKESKLTNYFDFLLNKCLNLKVWVNEQKKKKEETLLN